MERLEQAASVVMNIFKPIGISLILVGATALAFYITYLK